MSVAPLRPIRALAGNDPAVRLGVIMLCHDNLALAARMARIWSDGGARVVMHVDAKAPASEMAMLQERLEGAGVHYAPRRSCIWGTFSLVAATQDAAALLLKAHPEVTHVFLASGACLPLRPADELRRFLAAHPAADFIESVSVRDVGWTVGGLNEERFTLHFPFSFRQHRKLFDRFVNLQRRFGIRRRLPQGITPHIGSQWWCLTRPTLSAILDDPRREEFDRYFRYVWIPDESYFQTLMRRHSVRIESRSLTLAKFDAQGKPYVFYDDHLALLANSHIFVARKIWPGAAALYDAFPRRTDPASAEEEPDTEPIEALLDRAAARRRLGRPGLYMQSRFPRKDAENGKTAQPYVVIYGAADMFEGLAERAAEATGRKIHGHVLGRHVVEFADGAPIGPGALSSHVGLRNLDPQGFLASLIRSSEDVPAFLYSPRDRQYLNWFMATDPNAHLLVVTGTWIVPLVHSDMPFDDVRRIAAKLQRAEVRLLDILDSVWVKARVRRWSLAEALAQPEDLWSEICMTLRPEGGADQSPAPPLRDMTSVTRLIRDLRNAGLRPRKMGDPRVLRALTRPPAPLAEDAPEPAPSPQPARQKAV